MGKSLRFSASLPNTWTLTGLTAVAALWVVGRQFFVGSAYDAGFGTKI
jgi:hypothetical protein